MKRLRRWALGLLLALVILFVAGVLLLDTFARAFVIREIRNQTGLETKIGRVHISLFHPEITVEHLVLYNTAEFGGTPFIDLPELHVEYDREALFAHRLHCSFVRFNLARVNIVEDKLGRRNLDFLQPRNHPHSGNGYAPQKDAPRESNSGGMEFTGIDQLNLTLGKLTYAQMSQPGQIDELDMNCNQRTFPSIKAQQDVDGLLLLLFLGSQSSVRPDGSSRDWTRLFTPGKS